MSEKAEHGTGLTRAITTVCGVGNLRPAPGTWGSLAALVLALILHWIGGPVLLIIALVVVIFVGWWATSVEIAGQDNKDPSEIVIDEVAGQWIPLLSVSIGAAAMHVEVIRLWPGWIVSFLAFRLFDIWKPGWVGRADRRGGALGVMADDLIAGVFALITVIVLAGIGHGIMFAMK